MSRRKTWLVAVIALSLVVIPVWALAQDDMPVHRPNIFIRSSHTEPSAVQAGGEITLYVELHNVGDAGAQDIMVDFVGNDFVPVGSSSVKNVPSLQPDEHGTVWQPMRISASVTGNSLPITVKLTYKDQSGFAYTSSEVVGITLIPVTPTPQPQAGRPQLVIESFASEPPLPLPGEPFTLTLTLHNAGSGAARHILLTNGVPSVYAPLGSGNVTAVGNIGWQETTQVTLRLVADQATKPGLHTHPVTLDYDNWAGDHFQSAQNIAIELGKPSVEQPAASPLVVLKTYHVEPEVLVPGQPFDLTLDVANVGGGSARQVILTLGGQSNNSQSSSIAPLGTGNVKYLGTLAPAATGQVSSRFIVDGGASAGVYVMTIGFGYIGPDDTQLSRAEQISLVVKVTPQLELNFYRPLGQPLVGEPFALPIEIFNIGRTRLNSTNAEIVSSDLQVLSQPVYIGPLDAGTSNVLDGKAVAKSPGVQHFVVRVHYLDDFNQAQVYDQKMTVVVEAAPQARVIGPGESSGTGSSQAQKQVGDILPEKPQRPFLVRLVRGLLGLGSG